MVKISIVTQSVDYDKNSIFAHLIYIVYHGELSAKRL